MTMWPWGLQLGRSNAPSETAQAAYKGQLYQRRSDGIYLKDFGRGDSDDSAKLYSGQMLDFDGVDDYVDCGAGITIGTDFTITVTVYISATAVRELICCNIENTTNRIGISQNYGNFYLSYKNATGYHTAKIAATTGYYRVVGGIRGGKPFIYANGNSGSADSYVYGLPSSKLLIGSTGGGEYFDGLIGNVQIWNAAFDADDVAYDFNNCFLGDITAANRPGTSLSPSNLKGWWKLIEGSGSIAYDWSGNGNYGTLINFPTDDSQWVNAEQLSDPIVIQTALTEWGMGSNMISMSAMDAIRASLLDGLTGIDGDANAYKLIEDTTAERTHYLRLPNFTHNGGDELFLKLIVKPAGRNYLRIAGMDTTSGETYRLLEFVALSDSDPYCTDLGNGWFQVDISYTSDADQTQSRWFILLAESGTSSTYDGDGVSGVIFDYCVVGVRPLQACVRNICTNALVPIRTWETIGQFLRTHGELNWNGRSYADCGNGVDIAPTDTVLVETVFAHYSHEGTRGYVTSDSKDTCRVYPYYEDPVYLSLKLADGSSAYVGVQDNGSNFVEGKLYHIVLAYSKANQSFYGYVNGVASISNVRNPDTWQDLYSQDVTRRLGCSTFGSHTVTLLGQLPLFKMHINEKAQAIIDGDLDAWVQKQYLKAKAKYDL